MSNVLIVIDMQNDFVTGSLGNKDAQMIVPNVKLRLKSMQIAETGSFLQEIPTGRIIWIHQRERSCR